MGEAAITRLAVARLDELNPAQSHRNREEQPMHGFCLISGDADRCRVTLYVENGRPLSDRTGESGFYYEGWLVGPRGPLSLGAFNMGPGGQGSATRLVETGRVHGHGAELVRVTVEPFGGSAGGDIAVLEGPLVWLEAGLAMPSLAVADQALDGAADQAADGAPVLVLQTGGEAESSGVAAEGRAEAAAEAPVSMLEVEEPAGVDAVAEVVAEPTGPRPEPEAPEQRQVNPLALSVQLVQRHPMAPRAAGTAVVNLRQGSLQLMLRGLPSPTALGRDRSTDRPFNTYRVWLVNQQTHARTPAGFCERAWGENFRFRADGLPLNRHDTILVTVEDRTATGTNTASPQVLIGSYSE